MTFDFTARNLTFGKSNFELKRNLRFDLKLKFKYKYSAKTACQQKLWKSLVYIRIELKYIYAVLYEINYLPH